MIGKRIRVTSYCTASSIVDYTKHNVEKVTTGWPVAMM